MHFWLHENMLQVLFPYIFWKPRGLYDLCMRINTTTCNKYLVRPSSVIAYLAKVLAQTFYSVHVKIIQEQIKNK